MKLSSVSKHFLAMAAVLAAPITIQLERVATATPVPVQTPPTPPDARTVRLRQFFSRLHCPIRDMAEDFVRAADDNDLDWRLLPSISIIESSGGKAYKNNNIFGWDNGDQPFPTIRAGIHHVAFRLGRSYIYRNRTTEEKLKLYNPAEEYPGRVEDVMNLISPVEDLPAAHVPPHPGRTDLGFLARN